jgi:phage terminase large subunit-like protein
VRRRLRHTAAPRHPRHPPARRVLVCAMPDPTPGDLPAVDLDEYRNWRPESQARALELLTEYENSTWQPFYCQHADCDGNPHGKWDWQHARADQRPPQWWLDWLVWLLKGGRGSGKTRTGSEVTHRATEATPRVALIAATGPDLREIMVEGESGILATAPPGKRPLWEPSRKKLTWPNGCIGQGFSAEEPDRLRGPEHGFAWADEPAHWDLAQACWDNMLLGLRVKRGFHGKPLKPKVIATTTPKPTQFMKALLADKRTVTHTVSTYANLINLAPTFRDTILERYEGTRTGRQELHGEVLEDVEGALWNWEMFRYILEPPPMARIVVGVDPAGSTNKKSDDTGIITVGISHAHDLYVFADATGKYSPAGWAGRANGEYETFKADAIVPEKNYGGDMVRHTLETSGYAGARIIMAESRRGKELRAEPIVALYEKGRVFHVGRPGDLSELEDEQTTWVPGEGPSPNRVDALVHACTELAKVVMPAQIASPDKLLRNRVNRPAHLRVVG